MPPADGAWLLPGVDRAAVAAGLTRRLRAAGVPVDLSATQTFTRALDVVAEAVARRSALYWTARVTLVGHARDLDTFDEVFAAVFGDASLPVTPPARRAARPERGVDVPLPAARQAETAAAAVTAWARLPPAVGSGVDGDDHALVLPRRQASREAGEPDTAFADLDAAELRTVERALRDAQRHWPVRRSRRDRVTGHGRRVSLRRTLAEARRTGGDAVHVVRRAPRNRPRRLVMLCDVSRSMQPYVAAYLHVMRALTVGAPSEVFAFATRLTRLTTTLRHTSPEAAVAHATEEVDDRFGGTRIAASLRTLLRSHHGNALRGAIVVIASDGWDSDPPEELGAQMARLRRRARRVVWLNPRAGAPGYRPLAGGMAAALPYCDDLLPADDVAAVAAVLSAVVAGASTPQRHVDRRPEVADADA